VSGLSCLMVNTIVELADKNESVRAVVNAGQKKISRQFTIAVDRGKAEGRIASDIETSILVNQLLLSLNGLLLASKLIKSKKKMVNACKESLSLLLRA